MSGLVSTNRSCPHLKSQLRVLAILEIVENILPVINNASPSFTQVGKTKLKNIKEICRDQTKEKI